MTAEEERTTAPVIAPAWRELWAWACSQRKDWDAVAVQGVLVACWQAGVKYEAAAGITWRLAWDLTMATADAIAELRRLAGQRPAGGLDPAAKTALLARLEAAATIDADAQNRGSP